MPRHNENGRTRGFIINGRWSETDLRAMSEYVDQKIVGSRQKAPASRSSKQNAAIIKTTPEQIVRDFRRNEGFNISQEANMVRPLCRKFRRPIFFVRWWKAINWDLFHELKIFEWTCIILTILCLIYIFGFLIIGPFTLKLLRR